MSQVTHLKCTSNGRTFLYSEVLATRDDMIPCDHAGNILNGVIGDSDMNNSGQERRVSRFLGNPENGRLYPYTEVLATREDFISIDSESQWEAMRGLETEQPPKDPPVSLSRSPEPTLSPEVQSIHVEQELPPIVSDGDPRLLPMTDGMEPTKARAILCDWAFEHHGIKIDRRKSLESVLSECDSILAEEA